MKTIYLVRHGKASWDHPELSDKQRPLLPKGVVRTQDIGKYLQDKGVIPGQIIASPAVRAQATAILLAGVLGFPASDIATDERIYLDLENGLYELVAGLENAIESAMLVGHNPAMTNLVNALAGPTIDYLPTSGIAAISFRTKKWEHLPMTKGRLEFLIYPKMLNIKH